MFFIHRRPLFASDDVYLIFLQVSGKSVIYVEWHFQLKLSKWWKHFELAETCQSTCNDNQCTKRVLAKCTLRLNPSFETIYVYKRMAMAFSIWPENVHQNLPWIFNSQTKTRWSERIRGYDTTTIGATKEGRNWIGSHVSHMFKNEICRWCWPHMPIL